MRYKIIALGGGMLLLVPIGWQVGGALSTIVISYAGLIVLVAGGLAVAAALGGLHILFGIGRATHARARIAELATLQNGQPIHINDLARHAAPLISRTLERHYDVEEIRAAVPPALTSYHNEVHPVAPAELLAGLLGAGGLPQLVSPDAAAQLVAADEWRGWMDRAPHLLIAGRTDAGKTTLATALLTERALAGDIVLVLDPHYQPGKWAGVPTIGGGNNFDAILSVLPLLQQEMDARYKEFEQGRPTEDFQRLTILIDEVPALVESCLGTTPAGRPKVDDLRWIKFAKRLGSEARKVRLSVILLTQSTLVQDILINSQQRDNYLRVGLGDRAGGLLGEERNGQRKAQLQRLLVGQPHPAAMEWRGEIHLLDTHDVPALAARPLGTTVQAWTAPALPNQPAPPAQPAGAPLIPTERVGSVAPAPPRAAPETKQLQLTIPDQILILLDARPWLTSSEIATAIGEKLTVVRSEIAGMRRQLARRLAPAGKSDKYEYSLSKPLNELMAERMAISA